jgi:hypothetical protein
MNDWKESDWFKLWLALARDDLDEQTRQPVNRPAFSPTGNPPGCDLDLVPVTEWEVTE